MKTNLTVRNIIGAFVGGMVGILACYYAGVAYMPFACLIGVVLGFWHDKIIIDYRKNITIAGAFGTACSARVNQWKNGCVSYLNQPRECLNRWWAKMPTNKMSYIVRALSWVVSSPAIFIAWLRRHPMNRADTITCLVGVGIVAGLFKFGYLSSLFSKDEPFKNMSLPPPVAFGMFMATLMLFFFPVLAIALRGRADNDMAGFYHQYSKYSRYGAVGWSLFQLKNAVLLYAYGFIFSQLLLGALCLLIAGLLATIAFMLAVVVPARVFWRCVKLQGHWLCFGTTVLTTLIAWFSVRNHVNNVAMAWMLALVNGVCAALITEGLRHSYNWLVHKWDWLYELTHLTDTKQEDLAMEIIPAFLWRTIARPPLATVAHAWCRWVWPHVPRITFNPDGFLSPI
jgi:hypothetical protein